MTTGRRTNNLALCVSACLLLAAGRLTAAEKPAAPSAPAPISQEERDRRLEQLKDGLRRTLTELDAKLSKPHGEPTMRDLANGALALFLTGGDAKKAESYLERAFAEQDMNPASLRFGVVPWQEDHPEIEDLNAVEFTFQSVGPIYLMYGTELSAEFKERMAPHLKAGFNALRRHKVAVSYTNIFLMKSVALILCGEALDDKQAQDDGYALFDEWLRYTAANGIHEYDSPTYYAPDLNSLVVGYLLAARPGAREKFKCALDLFWTDMALNFSPSSGNMGGPHSRDYDFLRGNGGAEYYYFAEGFFEKMHITKPDLEKVYLPVALTQHGYHPSSSIVALSNQPERVVQQRWGSEPGQSRYAFVTPDFAIGSVSANYGPQDKDMAIDFAGVPLGTPQLTIVPDSTDLPYGKNKTTDASGHSKPHHWPLNPTMVQEKNALLTLLDLDPTKIKPEACLATNVIIPLNCAALYINDTKLKISKFFEHGFNENDIVGFRIANCGVAIRVFHAEGCDKQNVRIRLKADEGAADSAMRLAIYHYKVDGPLTGPLEDKHVRVGIFLSVEACSSDKELEALIDRVHNAEIEEFESNDSWQVTATYHKTALLAVHDFKTRHALRREINGKPAADPLFTDNGAEPEAVSALRKLVEGLKPGEK